MKKLKKIFASLDIAKTEELAAELALVSLYTIGKAKE